MDRKEDEHPQPADHNQAGFFIGGPQEASSPTARLAQTPIGQWTPETPLVAHSRMDAERARKLVILDRHAAFIAEINGVKPARRRYNRRAA